MDRNVDSIIAVDEQRSWKRQTLYQHLAYDPAIALRFETDQPPCRAPIWITRF